ncbi:hypothetical protein SHAM105786_15980 [Shewanella amazonensis]
MSVAMALIAIAIFALSVWLVFVQYLPKKLEK